MFFVSFLSEVFSKLFDVLVDLHLNFLDNLVDNVLLDLECFADVVRDNAVGDSLLTHLHAALGDEDGFFSTEGICVRRVHLGFHHLDLRPREALVGVSEDGGTGYQSVLESAGREGSLVHEAHGVVTGGDLSPDRVLPGLATEPEDGGNTVLSLLRDDMQVLLVVVVLAMGLLQSFSGFLDAFVSSFNGLFSSMLGSLALGFMESVLGVLEGFLGSVKLMLEVHFLADVLSDSDGGLGQGSSGGTGDSGRRNA